MSTNNEIAVKAWIAAVENNGDPDEWKDLLKLSWEELTYYSPEVVAKVLVEKYRANMLAFFPEPVRSLVVITTAKHRRSTTSTTSTGSTANASSSGTGGSRGKAYVPKLNEYRWTYKGKTATIRRVDGGWAAEYDGLPVGGLGVFPTHTKAIEAVYRHCGVEAAINAVKLAKLREQDAAAGFTDS